MKKISLFLILFLINSGLCFARIGDTSDLIETLYGQPVGQSIQTGAITTVKYQSSLYNISVDYRNGRAEAISYQLVNQNKMSMDRIARLLSDNGVLNLTAEVAPGYSEISPWYFDARTSKKGVINFIVDSGKLKASYFLKNNILLIKSASYR